ncbi:hypothetical protein AX17_002100 [Amanita inopinata Kibby_2008]|nr:hypothetical protein AX17_002100 [Amanita inopinata Kibby_2008]
MRFSLVQSLAVILKSVPAIAAIYDTIKVKESISPPHGWTKHALAPSDHEVDLHIGLPQSNFPLLEKHLFEISDPSHERYGAYLSKEDVEELVAPHPSSVEAVDEWLASHGLREGDFSRSPAKDWVFARVPVWLAERMLNTTYHVWQHEGSGDYLVRTTSYSLPETLHAHVDVIQPTNMFARWSGFKSNIYWPEVGETREDLQSFPLLFDPLSDLEAIQSICNKTVTIPCLLKLYNATGYVPQAAKHNSIGITGYLEEFANIHDLQMFYADQRREALGSKFKFISVKGGLNNQSRNAAGVEANLDVQYAFGLTHPTPGTFWSTAGRPPFKPDLVTPSNTNEPYNSWVNYVLSHDHIPLSISTSYGDVEQTVPESYARRVCKGFAQIGVRGVSLMFSSGDGGVGDGSANASSHKCYSNDGRNVTRFLPTFPASVTAVGGTNFVPETAAFFSGGGFSDYFPQPAYQKAAVKAYLKKLSKGKYEGLFNRTGRAIPDVAALGRNYRVWLKGKPMSVGGTSAASPTFAAIVAMLNDARLAKKLPPLGFLNPLLYKKGLHGLNDITEGNNPGCGTPGFNATKGWDPITGLGTPNFYKLKELVIVVETQPLEADRASGPLVTVRAILPRASTSNYIILKSVRKMVPV